MHVTSGVTCNTVYQACTDGLLVANNACRSVVGSVINTLTNEVTCSAPNSVLCRNADKKRLSDVAVLDLDSFTWWRPAVNGIAPSPREGAAAVYHAGHMVVFGE
jgi:hypothetical protein